VSDEIALAQQALADEFAFFDNWMDRYQYIIDLGRQLDALPDELKTDEHLLHGCQSRVWLVTRVVGERLEFDANSDSAIVSGLIALLRRVYNGRHMQDISENEPTFVSELGLDRHLSPTRSNGLAAMVEAVRNAARQGVCA
jgi:cysteine desulfuration protein SufE